MFEVVKKDLYWMIQNSNKELVYIVRKTGWIGLKSDLPEYAKINKRLAVHPLMFGHYDKANAVKTCERLNKRESLQQAQRNNFYVCIECSMHSIDESPYDSFGFDTKEEAEEFMNSLIWNHSVDPKKVFIKETKKSE